MRDYATQRFEEGSRALFNRTHPLAEAIMKGWKEHSPVDCLIISPEFELMGRQLVNELFEDSSRSGLSLYEYYLTFLKEALDGKQPGLGNLTLTKESPLQEVLDVFRAPGNGYQDYTVVNIDTTAFKDGGTLTIYVQVGRTDAAGSFDLFESDAELPTEGIPEALVSAWGIKPNTATTIHHRFKRGEVFKLGATGDWFSKKGDMNAFYLKISVEEN